MPLHARASLAGMHRFDPALFDTLLGGLLLLEIELQVWLNPHLSHRLPAALAGVLLSAAVAARRRFPLWAILIVAAGLVVHEALGGRVTQHAVGALVAIALLFYTAGASLPERAAWFALGLGLVGIVADVAIAWSGLSELFFATIFVGLLPWALGRLLRERGARERADRAGAERLDAGREQRTLAAAFGERARIARELHDVIAHSVSVMVIQAGGARVVMDSEPDRADTALHAVERAGREALAEMRRLLGVLGDGGNPRALAPQPGLADIDELLRSIRAAGLATDLSVEGDAVALPPALDLCAYRIVQEALTNAIKHAGPARATVRLHWTRETLELEVADNGCGATAVNGSGGGHGIAGMRERAALHGGRVETSDAAGRGFEVRAQLPLTQQGVRT